MTDPDKWQKIEAYMREFGVAELAIRIFGLHYQLLAAGSQSYIGESEIEPVDSLPGLDQLPAGLEAAGAAALPHTVVLKLNGGLGTSMGLAGPKSLLPLRGGMTFLDLIAAQTRSLKVSLLLMNSFATDAATAQCLCGFREAGDDRFLTFQQHRVPKLRADDLTAVQWERQPDLAWCPPGHGDLYAAIVTSGTLDRLLAQGSRYMFVSNADNLGATLDLRILGYMVEQQISFLMEAADRTPADRKGGHLARQGDGTLLLREMAQCHDDDQQAFQDIARHRYFNTNNLWIDLQVLAAELKRRDNVLPLSLIVNRKTVDPVDPASPEVYQLETAMGSVISHMPNAAALRVPRSRFAPVKTTGDLLCVRSDAYEVDGNYAVQLIAQRNALPPVVKLDDRYYKTVADLDRLIGECPSLRECQCLTIEGPVLLGPGVRLVGDVELIYKGDAPLTLAAGEYRGRCELG